MTKIRYKGTSTVREVTIDQLEAAGMAQHEDKAIYVDVRDGERARVVDVAEPVAERLMELEPTDWERLSDEESSRLEAVDQQYKKINEARANAAAEEAATAEAKRQAWLTDLEAQAAAAAEEEQDQADLERLREQ